MTDRSAIDAEKVLSDTLAEAYAAYAKALTVYASMKVNDKELVEDLIQETYTKAWRYLIRGNDVTNMRAFLYHTLHCLIIDEYRRKAYCSLDELMTKGFDPSTKSVPKKIMDRIDGKAALKLIPQLPDRYNRILTLRYLQCLSYAEICEQTGMTRNGAGVQVHRGIAKLKRLYLHEANN